MDCIVNNNDNDKMTKPTRSRRLLTNAAAMEKTENHDAILEANQSTNQTMESSVDIPTSRRKDKLSPAETVTLPPPTIDDFMTKADSCAGRNHNGLEPTT